MTDNRTNEPTEAQVEAAARAYDPEAWAARDKYAADGTGTQVELDLMVEYSLGKARAALVAAQGAAPQAESEPNPHTRVVTRSFDSDCALGICMRGCSHLMWVCDSCSSEGGWGAARGQLKKWAAEHVCPVLPSSGVDEDALAEEIGRHKLVHVSASRKSAFCACNPSVTAGVDDNQGWFKWHLADAVLVVLAGLAEGESK